jgi:hypothetical protein
MANFREVKCSCGQKYYTDDSRGNCPSCNSSESGDGGCGAELVILIVTVALILVAILMIGSIAWSIYAWRTHKSKWHTVGSLALGLIALPMYSAAYTYAEFPIMTIITFTLNILGVLISLVYIFKD